MHDLQDTIIVVTGLPRSGTSMLMRMLAAGGTPILADEVRAADDHNPHGYHEFALVKRLKEGAEWLPQARGKAVKVVSYLLPFLPLSENYRVVFAERALEQVVASQDRMLRKAPGPADDRLLESLQRQNDVASAWIEKNAVPCLRLRFEDVHWDATEAAEQLAAFTARGLDVEKMAAAVDDTLYRNRSENDVE